MGNHFHLLVRVPEKREEQLPEEVILQRMHLVYDGRTMKEFCGQLEKCAHEGARRTLLEPYERRMGHLGVFMRTLKQRFCLRSAQTMRNGRASSGNPFRMAG